MDYPRCSKTGKVCFPKKDAETKRNSLKHEGRERTLRVYQCEYCDYWHLTHVSPYHYDNKRNNRKKKTDC